MLTYAHTRQVEPVDLRYDLLEWYGDGTRWLLGVVPSPTLQVKLWM